MLVRHRLDVSGQCGSFSPASCGDTVDVAEVDVSEGAVYVGAGVEVFGGDMEV